MISTSIFNIQYSSITNGALLTHLVKLAFAMHELDHVTLVLVTLLLTILEALLRQEQHASIVTPSQGALRRGKHKTIDIYNERR